jgi:hypothetical protein
LDDGKKYGPRPYDVEGKLIFGEYLEDRCYPGDKIEQHRIAPTQPNTDRAKIAAGWSAMQANPANG